jgi:hypothetical protein
MLYAIKVTDETFEHILNVSDAMRILLANKVGNYFITQYNGVHLGLSYVTEEQFNKTYMFKGIKMAAVFTPVLRL